MDSSDEEDVIVGPGWAQIKLSINQLQENLNMLCETLNLAVDIENIKQTSTRRVEIRDSSRRILDKQAQFMEKFKEKLESFKCTSIDGGESELEYIETYITLTREVDTSISTLLDGVVKQLSLKTDAEKKLSNEFATLEISFHQLESQIMKEKIRYDKLTAEVNVEKARCRKLEQQLVEKSNLVKQLRRESTVALWVREKQKIEEAIATRESELAWKLNNVSDEFDETRNKLQNKIRELQYQNSILKTRNNTRNGITRQEADELKRILFVKERALIIAESEVKKQQVYYGGLLTGLVTDFQIMMSKDNISVDQFKHHHREFYNRMKKISQGVEEGNLVGIRSTLPSHYLGTGSNVKSHPIKISEVKPVIFADDMDESVDLDKIKGNETLLKWRKGSSVTSPSLKKLLEGLQKDNPVLIMKNGTLRVKEAITYYPNYSEEKIRHLFQMFKSLDDNGDLSLDTAEILHNLPRMLGRLATTEEVADTVREIDIDESGTIDFFEFLLLNQLLEQGEGKSRLIKQQSENKKKESYDESKVCAVM